MNHLIDIVRTYTKTLLCCYFTKFGFDLALFLFSSPTMAWFEKLCGNMIYNLSCSNNVFQYNPFDTKNEQGPLDWIYDGPKNLMHMIWIGFHITLSRYLSLSISHENCASTVNIFKRFVYQGSTKLRTLYKFNCLCKSHFNIKKLSTMLA